MRILSLVSQKGGVGKTTLALNLSYAFASRGQRTLLVDVDPQGAIGHSLPSAPSSPGIVGYLSGRAMAERVIIATRLPTLRILPLGELAPSDTRRFSEHLSSGAAIDRLASAVAADVDLMIIDTPCGFGGATEGALRASDAALTPLQAEPIAIRTLPQLLEMIATLRSEGSVVSLVGAVLTMLQLRDESSLDVAQEAWARLPSELVLETTVPRDPVFLAASARGVPLGLLARKPPPVFRVFDQLADEIATRLSTEQEEADEPLDLFA
ncbi:MAG TPA: ParA family protein [Polyangiaceae bacterium]|nr:ParA family protein [Polyangiaceae bacterium]